MKTFYQRQIILFGETCAVQRMMLASVVILILMLNHLVAIPLNKDQLNALRRVFADLGVTCSDPISEFSADSEKFFFLCVRRNARLP
jgi:hypothetical protein